MVSTQEIMRTPHNLFTSAKTIMADGAKNLAEELRELSQGNQLSRRFTNCDYTQVINRGDFGQENSGLRWVD